MGIFKLFKKTKPIKLTESVNYDAIDESFQSLKVATAEVTLAATEAAKVLQDRLEDSEIRFYRTIDSIKDLVLIKDAEGRWKILNKFGQKVFNMYHGEYFNKTDTQLIEEFPILKETLTICAQTDNKTWKSQKSQRFEECIPQGDTFTYLDVIKTPTFEDDGSKKELIIIGRDITEIYERTKREKACFQALNSASDAIAIIDKKSHIFFCNDQFINLFKFKQYHNIINQPLNEILPNFPVFDKMWETIQQNKSWSIYCPQHLLNVKCSSCNVTECPHEKSCNKTKCPLYQMHVNIMPMMNGQPKPIYYICTFKTNQYK